MLNGHSTSDALRILDDELKAHLDAYLLQRKRFFSVEGFHTFHHRTKDSTFHWTSGLYLAISATLLAISFAFQNVKDAWILVEVVVLMCFFIFNSIFTFYDNHLKHQEAIRKAKQFLSELADCYKKHKWKDEFYINLNCPISQCVSLQWTIRDSKVINLPCSLLVEGDVILLRPGQTVPGNCRSLKSYSREKDYFRHIQKDEFYIPPHSFIGIDDFNNLSTCTPLQPEPYILLETPFIYHFRLFLEKSHLRPCGALEKERYNVYSTFFERKLIPAILIVMLAINILRFFLCKEVVGSFVDMLIALQVQSIFPLLAISFPVLWKLLNLFGTAKVLVLFENLKNSTNLSTFGSQRVITTFFNLVMGDPSNLPRTVNIVQSLGNLTSFCCVDKKGILSWPNPSAEKVFFLTNSRNKSDSGAACQVLNLTQDTKNHNGLFFDDSSWKNHLTSLKPLGLNILSNTCNLKTTEKYTEFADHVKCMSLKKREAVPVVNRRCFCELARQIGFNEQATNIFATEDVFGIYQHDTSFVRKNELLQHEKYKMPMPNMFCVSIKDLSTSTKQLFSQGMADLLLSMCSDYWDGSKVCPLGSIERKKIADFYHRNSMTSYCTAYSYRPFNTSFSPNATNNYLEVSQNLFGSLRHLETSFWDGRFKRKHIDIGCHEELDSVSTTNSYNQATEQECKGDIPLRYLGNQIFIGMVTMQYQAKQEIVNLIENLESSCSRFVHFSKENELRSRGFSEKMGLEAGWNCHISLLSEVDDIPPRSETCLQQKTWTERHPKKFGSAPILKLDSDEHDKFCISPEQVMTESATKDDACHAANKPPILRKPSINSNLQQVIKAKKMREKRRGDLDNSQFWTLIQDKGTSQSESPASSMYSSYIEGLSEIQNRARLPKGIENIRPHIRDIDNVPLQVSLFTDCTTSTTCEMLQILQEFGEVTCCLGSSLNIDNPSVFLQADCSISKDPVYPQICNQQKSCGDPSFNEIGPLELSAKMQSLPCFLMLEKTEISCFPRIVAMAQTHCQRVRTAARLYLSFQLCISCLQLINSLAFLPPCLSPQLILWLSAVVVPIFSLCMLGNPGFLEVTPSVQGKNQKKMFHQLMIMEVVSFLIRFLPSLFICLMIHAINLYELCRLCGSSTNSSLCECHILWGIRKDIPSTGDWNGWTTQNVDALLMSQHFTTLQLVFYFALISMCNIHRYNYLWEKSLLQNHFWCIVTLIIISLQTVWFFCAFSPQNTRYSFKNISLAGCLIFVLWIFLIILLHELVKKREIRVWIRHQKRARLDFGTKLGMNSPF